MKLPERSLPPFKGRCDTICDTQEAQKSYIVQGLNKRYLICHVTAYVTNDRENHLPSPAEPPHLLKLDKKRTHQASNLSEF